MRRTSRLPAPLHRTRVHCSTPAPEPLSTCRRCRASFTASSNGPHVCRYHPALFTGGEVGKYLGFVPRSGAVEDQLKQRGLVRFWDCCGALSEGAPGCATSRHWAWDDCGSEGPSLPEQAREARVEP